MSLDAPVYDLWYAAHYPISDLQWRRDSRDRELFGFLDTLQAHIRAFGIRYPIGVSLRTTGIDVRPGKCRVTVARHLGFTALPAIVTDFTRSGARSPDWVRLPYNAQAIQDQFFAGSDSQVEVSRRFFSIKKRDTVRRPGVEDEFARELRTHDDATRVAARLSIG